MAKSTSKRVRPSRDGILEAAEQLFSERGFAEVSLRDLIAACGCSTTAFYARFPSKDAVLEALLGEWVGALAQTASQALPRARSMEEGFDLGVDLLTDWLDGRKGLARVFLCEASCTGARHVVLRSYTLLAELLTSRFERLIECGESHLDNPQQYAWALVGALNMQVWRWAVAEEIDDAALEDALRATARAMKNI